MPTLRTITYNVFHARGWRRTDNGYEHFEDRGDVVARYIAESLAAFEPDIVSLCEAPDEQVVQSIADRLGMNVAFFPSPQHWPGALLSRWPIIRATNCPLVEPRPADLFTRHYGMALLEAAGTVVAVHSAHLYPHRDGQPIRNREIDSVLRAIADHAPGADVTILQGDLNHRPDWEEYARWTGAGMVDTATAAEIGDSDRATVMVDNLRAQLDYVWLAGAEQASVAHARALTDPAFITVPNTDGFAPADHVPFMADLDI